MTTLRDPGVETAPGTIRFERHMPGPIHRVWDYITHPTIRGRWLGTGPMDIKAGGKYEITLRHDELTPHAEIAPERFETGGRAVTLRGEVTECKFPFIIEMTWPQGGPDSKVGFVLTSVHGLVRVTLTHSGLQDRATQIEQAARWHAHLNILEAKANNVIPPPFWKRFADYEQKYAELFPG